MTSHRDHILQDRDLLRSLHDAKRSAIRRRLSEFASVQPGDWFHELLFCLMTPQSSAKNAEAVVEVLRALDFETREIDPEPVLRSAEHYIRFHVVKATYLLQAKRDFARISGTIEAATDARVLREWLAHNVLGLGMKESTHFLRNIGRNDGLAILDRHILRNLVRHGAIRELPRTLTKKQYLEVEVRFKTFANEMKIPLDELDLLFWSMETGEIRK